LQGRKEIGANKIWHKHEIFLYFFIPSTLFIFLPLLIAMAYRNKCYTCFDGDTDMHYYRLLTAWHANDNFDFSFYDAHELTQARDSSTEESIKRSLRERLNNSREFLLLIGNNTRNLYRFVRWEIETAIALDLPIIAVNLNGLRKMDENLCPPILKPELAIHISFNQKIIDHALNNWPEQHRNLKVEEKTGAYFYPDLTYTNLGIQ
jgi:MTH538 TIR-like domain (DUF1863)